MIQSPGYGGTLYQQGNTIYMQAPTFIFVPQIQRIHSRQVLRRIINRKSMKISLKEMILKRWKNAIKSIRKELEKIRTWKELI
jgi:hypothetical protein